MSSIHYFQRYSQPENVATNNTLLLLSRLYQDSPIKFNGFLNDLFDDYDLESGIQFFQQRKGTNSIPDGSLSQVSFKVIIETKLHKHFSVNQLIEHLNGFGNEENMILLSLSPKEPDKGLKDEIRNKVSKYNTKNNKSIRYIPTTFQKIVDKFNNSINDYDIELLNILNDYEAYCIQDKLIIDESLMRVVTCGWTLEENFQYNIYYDPANRGYSEHNYIGIYSNKAVRGIGKINNIITADKISNDQLKIIESTTTVTKQQEEDILGVMEAARHNNNWDITKEHKFFCVDKFYPTLFKKNSKYPLQGTKFFNLKNRLNVSKLPDVEEIAQLLRAIDWEQST